MKELLDKYGKLVLNAALAGFWVGLATFVEGRDLSWAALLSAGSAALRFGIGFVAMQLKGVPTIPVDA